MRKKARNKGIKLQLFLRCGTVDMYDMKRYAKEKLTLHHEPPFSQTRHTVFEESYLLTRENHDYIEYLKNAIPIEYIREMSLIKQNKLKLIREQ